MKPTYSLIVFFTDDHKILLQDRRSIAKEGEEWGLFGGKIYEDETYFQALLRETKEELDVDLKEDLIFLGLIKSPITDDYSALYLHKLMFDHTKVNVGEGDGCELFSEQECSSLELNIGDRYRSKLVFEYLRRRS